MGGVDCLTRRKERIHRHDMSKTLAGEMGKVVKDQVKTGA